MRNYRKTAEAISKLSPEQYGVTQQSGTEAPRTSEYLDNKEPGIYVDVVSGEPLFASSDKFELGYGYARVLPGIRAFRTLADLVERVHSYAPQHN